MKKGFKGFFSLMAVMVMIFAFNIVAFADEPPYPPKTPTVTGWSDTTITVAAENGWEYLIWGLDGTMSSWNQPSYADLIAGTYTFTNLKPGMGYRIYARAQATDVRKAWDLPVSDDSWSPAYVVLTVSFEGVVKTPDYPKDIESYLPAYVYIYDGSGNEVAALLTEWNGHFKGNANGACDLGTYKLVAYSSKNNAMRIESTITVPVTEMKEYMLSDTPAPTEAPTQAPTEPPTQAPTVAPTQAPTQAPTAAPTQAPTQKPTEKATEEPTQKRSEMATEKPTQKPTEKATEKPTQKPTEKATEKETQKPTEVVSDPTKENVTEASTAAPTEAPTEPSTEAPTEPTFSESITATPTEPVVAPVPGGNNSSTNIWLIFGVIIAIAAVAGIVFAVKKFGK